MFPVTSKRIFIGTAADRTASAGTFLPGDRFLENDTDGYYLWTGMEWEELGGGGGGTPGGADTNVQINDGGALYGDSGFVYSKVANTVTLTDAKTTPNLEIVTSGSDSEASILFDDGAEQYAIGVLETTGTFRIAKNTDLTPASNALLIMDADPNGGYIAIGGATITPTANSFFMLDTAGQLVILGQFASLRNHAFTGGYALYTDPGQGAIGIGNAPVSGDMLTIDTYEDKQLIKRDRSNYSLASDVWAHYIQARNSSNAWVTTVSETGYILDNTASSEDGGYQLETAVGGSLVSRVYHSSTETVINESGSDLDWRVESDANTHMIFVDAGNNAFQVGTTVAGAIADFRSTSIVFNEAGADLDIRFEGDAEPNLFFIDASSDRIGVGTNAPESLVTIGDPTGDVSDTNLLVSGIFTVQRDNSSQVGAFQNYNKDTTDGNGVVLSFNTDTTGTGATVRKAGAQIRGVFDTHDDSTYQTSIEFWTRVSGGFANRLAISGDKVGIGTDSPAQTLDIVAGSAGGIRASDVIADTTNKDFRFLLRHYDNSEEDIALFGGGSFTGETQARFGGGFGVQNAATRLLFYAASSTTTLNGTLMAVINSNGMSLNTALNPTTSATLDIGGTSGALLIPRLTTTQRNALTATNGMLIYNSTTAKFQGRAGGAWVDLH